MLGTEKVALRGKFGQTLWSSEMVVTAFSDVEELGLHADLLFAWV